MTNDEAQQCKSAGSLVYQRHAPLHAPEARLTIRHAIGDAVAVQHASGGRVQAAFAADIHVIAEGTSGARS